MWRTRISFSNHSRWGFFNQFGEFSSLAKFVGGSQEDASPFGSAARYIRAYVPHSFIIVEGLGRVGIQNTHPPSANIFLPSGKSKQTERSIPTSVKLAPKSKQRTAEYSGLPYWLTWLTLGTLLAHSGLILGSLWAHLARMAHLAHSWLTHGSLDSLGSHGSLS